MSTQDDEIVFRRQFDKITLFNFISLDLINYASQKYGPEFSEYVDMTCGAVPEGDYEKVIDVASPAEFLNLYTGIVLKRFMLVCNKLIELGPGYDRMIADYLFKEGQNLGMPKPVNVTGAFDLLQLCILENLNARCGIDFLTSTPSFLSWKNEVSDLAYWKITADFVRGLLDSSPIEFSVDEGGIFTLKTKS